MRRDRLRGAPQSLAARIVRLEDRILPASAVLLQDVNPTINTQPSTQVNSMLTIGTKTYMALGHEGAGGYLYVSDGTTGGTTKLADFETESPAELTDVNGTLFFVTRSTSNNGISLWKSDATVEGTVSFATVYDSQFPFVIPTPENLVSYNGQLYFTAQAYSGGSFNNHELWKSDGTEAGTVKVTNISSFAPPQFDSQLTVSGSNLYFVAANAVVGVSGESLWKSDGTKAGTVLVKDINANYSAAEFRNLTDVNGTLFFAGDGGITGTELWKSDGTSTGTTIVKDINIEGGTPSSSNPIRLTNVNGRLYFVATNGFSSPNSGYQLWTSDGTSAGTTLVKKLGPFTYDNHYPASLTNANGTLFFVAFNPATFAREVWKTDGTDAGTVSVTPGAGSSFAPSELLNVGGEVYFKANSATGIDLWKSSGSPATKVKDIPTSGAYVDRLFVGNQGKVFFTANDSVHGTEVWVSDGTSTGTAMLKELAYTGTGSSANQLVDFNGRLAFVAHNGTSWGLWLSDNAASQATLVKTFIGSPSELKKIGNLLYFLASDSTNGAELWKSDGTAAGTTLVTNIAAGAASSTPHDFVEFKGAVYFWATDGSTAVQLWKTDGTAAGTSKVKSFASVPTSSSTRTLLPIGDTLYFVGTTAAEGSELWKTDGTTAGTVLVKDVLPGSAGSSIEGLTEFNGVLYFGANTGAAYRGLWKSDGTAEGTVLLRDGILSQHGVGLKPLQGLLYFPGRINNRYEVWRTDGTAAGTAHWKDGSGSGLPTPGVLTPVGDNLYFTVSYFPLRLYATDGIAFPTPVLSPNFPNPTAQIFEATPVNHDLYFARFAFNRAELWRSGGTPATTFEVANVEPHGHANLQDLTVSGAYLYFTADVETTGREVWSVYVGQRPTAIDVTPASVAENAVVGSLVATLSSTDPESGETFTYSLVGGTGSGDNSLFQIVGNELRTAATFDFELQSTYSVRVRTTDHVGLWYERAITISIADHDEFNVTTPVDANGAPNLIAEGAASGTSIGLTGHATDADGANNIITYSLIDNFGGRFAIDFASGVVTAANGALIDYESATAYFLQVRAASSDGSTATNVFTINVQDVDEFDVSSITDANGLPNQISENAAAGALVGITGSASDLDATNNAITYSLADDAGGRFTIDPGTGVVTAKPGGAFDYEVAQAATIVVQATSADGSSAMQSFVIAIADVNEFDVSSISDTNAQPDAVDENAAAGATAGITAFAADADGSQNAVTYSLLNSAGGRFAINGTTGVVTVANGTLLDREASASHTISVQAASSDGSTSTQAFVITLIDVNDNAISPLTDANPAFNQVFESSPVGTPVGITGFAVDPDGTNSTVTYSLTSDANGRFVIDPSTGMVTVAKSEWLDREHAAAWSISILARSQDGSVSEKAFTINLLDTQDTSISGVSDANLAANMVSENSSNGTLVGITALAVDIDLSHNTVTYSLTANANGRFAIDPATGVVSVAKTEWLDREAATAWSITVKATSEDGSSSVKAFTIHLGDVDEFNVAAVTDSNTAANSVVENAPNGTAVGITAAAADRDATNSAITYSLTSSANGRFAINPVTGVVTVAKTEWLDREAAAAWSITVLATSADGSSNSKAFSIALTDVDEFNVSPATDINDLTNLISENAAAGTAVGITARAVDADSTTSSVTYSLVESAGGRFAIEAATGIVAVANPDLLDLEGSGQSSWSITIRATSADGSTSQQAFTINVSDVDDFDVTLPVDANAAPNAVPENSSVGTHVGLTGRAFDRDVSSNAVTYSLTDDAGGRFLIHPTTGLVSVAAGAVLDFEAATVHVITVRADSSDGSSASQSFTINVINTFDAPRVTLSSTNVEENRPSGTVVGTLGVTDLEVASPVYSLVAGDGGTDNARFSISGNQLRTQSSFNFESQTSYSVRVQMLAADGTTLTQVFVIQVTNVNERPNALSLSRSTIAENNAVGAVIGTLQGSDPDAGDGLNYTLVSGTGSTDNARFTIQGNQLKAAEVFDYERKRTYRIRVRVTDAGGLTYERTLTINVSNGPG